MTDISPDGAFVAQFNARLEALNSSARVALAEFAADAHLLELRDDEENFLELIPAAASPEMAAIAYRLYGRGFNHGIRVGEAAARAKLRHLIGAAPASPAL